MCEYVCLHFQAWVTCPHVADGVGESAAIQQVTDVLSALVELSEVVQGVSGRVCWEALCKEEGHFSFSFMFLKALQKFITAELCCFTP